MDLIQYSHHYSSGSQTLMYIGVMQGTTQYRCLGYSHRRGRSREYALDILIFNIPGDCHAAVAWNTI